MSLTRLEMANEVLDNLGRDGSASTRSGTTLSNMAVRWLNRAQRQVARKYDLIFKESTSTTVDGTKDYSFPDALRAVFSIRLEDGVNSRKLSCVMPWEFDIRVPKPDVFSESVSTYYIPYKASNQFELYPIPDAAYTLRLRHSSWPTDFAADASTSDYHDANIDIDDVLVTLATASGYAYLQELIDARDWHKRGWDRMLEVWVAERNTFPDWAPSGYGFTLNSAPMFYGEYYNDPFFIGRGANDD